MSEAAPREQPDIPSENDSIDNQRGNSENSDSQNADSRQVRTPIFTTDVGRQIFAEDSENMARRARSRIGIIFKRSGTTFQGSVIFN